MRITDASDFGRVAVLMGGRSSERAVSLDSGQGVLAALRGRAVDAFAVDGIEGLLSALHAGQVDRVFNVLHGRDGEDGVVQGLLEAYSLPVTGSGVLGSALTMDKVQTKRVFDAAGLPHCAWATACSIAEAEAALGRLGLPLIAKPACEGSTVGVGRIHTASDLSAAFAQAQPHGLVLFERLIVGAECTVGIIADTVLPPIRIVPKGGFYDYHAKYVADDTDYLIPTSLGSNVDQQMRDLARAAFEVTGCSGWGRVDFLVDAAGKPWLLEVNTAPGMTSHSLVPKAAAAIGWDYAETCWRILETSFKESVYES